MVLLESQWNCKFDSAQRLERSVDPSYCTGFARSMADAGMVPRSS